MGDHKPGTHPSGSFSLVTPHATDPIVVSGQACRALYIGGSGNIAVRGVDNAADVTITNVPVGVLPIAVTHVRVAGTTATNILALF